MARPLRSNAHQPRSLPWEMIGYILSFCDTATLPALSLMSFASWEMAGPILYEHAAVRSFDDLKSLFLLTLTLEISSWDQCKKPKIKRSRKIIYRDFDPSPERSLPPHRLDRSGILRLPLETLVLPSSDATRSLLAFLSYLVFVFLDPLTVVYSKAEGVREGVNTWIGRPISSDLSFLEGWTRLERVTWAGPHLFGRCFDPGVDRIIPMYAAEDLTASTRPDRRTLKFVLDLAAHAEPGAPVRSPMGTFLGGAGISQELAGRVRLAVKLIVYAAEEVAVRDEVAGLELWTKELILVETV